MTLFAGCYEFDLTNTAHPDEGTVIVNISLPESTSASDVPTSVTVEIDGERYTVDDETSLIPKFFDPGEYTMYVYNESEGVTFESGIATVAVVDGAIQSNIDATFFSMQTLTITADYVTLTNAPLTQIDGEVKFNFAITSGDPDNVARATASLTGITREWDCVNNAPYGDPATMLPTMTQGGAETRSADNDTISSTIQMLGTNGGEQLFTMTLTYIDGAVHSVTHDVSALLSGFNSDKQNPVTLSADIAVTTDIEGGKFTIENWSSGDSIVDGEMLAPER